MIVKFAGLTFTTTSSDLKQKLVRIKLNFLNNLVGRKLVLQIKAQTLESNSLIVCRYEKYAEDGRPEEIVEVMA